MNMTIYELKGFKDVDCWKAFKVFKGIVALQMCY